jgi:citronellyl-CoA dehydrogenase
MLLTEQHEQLRSSAVRFVENEINPFVDEWEKAEEFPSHAVFKKLGALGVLGVKYDEAYGGMGLDFSYSAIAAEARAKKHGVEMPICEAVYSVVKGEWVVDEAIEAPAA